jgi:hypothetical protein
MVFLLAASTTAQTSFSIDYRGPTISTRDPNGVAITEGDILTPSTASGFPGLAAPKPPTIAISAGMGGLRLMAYPGCVGSPPGTGCGVEVDALSYGRDGPASSSVGAGAYWFSVDKNAIGIPPTGAFPNVFTEGSTVFLEAAADVFIDLGIPMPPACPIVVPVVGNVGAIDGDGLPNAGGTTYPGLGLFETNPPGCPPPPFDLGDTVDAIDVDGPIGRRVFFSLDDVVINPTCGTAGTGSAAANGLFTGGDVLMIGPGLIQPIVYASAPLLGLNLLAVGQDDLDALALFENGDFIYQPSQIPYDWQNGATDMLLFSVRAGSAVVGRPSSNCGGRPIEPGDILTTPLAGGGSPFPAIFIAAETLGLRTNRSTPALPVGDDMDALDVVRDPVFDCQCNGVEDALELALANAGDANQNGIPDECEFPLFYCSGKTTSAGCVPFLTTEGTPSVSGVGVGPFNVISNDHVEGEVGIYLFSLKKNDLNFHGGKLCVRAPFTRLSTLIKTTDGLPCSSCPGHCRVFKRNFNQLIQSGSNPVLTCGQTVFVQVRQRDTADPAGFGDNLSNGVRFVIGP